MADDLNKQENNQKIESTSQNTSTKIYSDDNIDVTTYKCPNCGGETFFDPKVQKIHCLYCGSMFEIENKTIATERNLTELLESGNVWTEAEVYQCKTCGAKEILNSQEVSIKCPFCGTNNIIKTEELPGLKPQGITPFKLDKNQTSQIATKWAKKKLYAPRDFKKSVKPENIQGVYNPVFTFDAQTDSTYNGTLGKNYTTYRYINGKRVACTETRYFNISGLQTVTFDDILIQASSTIPTKIVNKIEPFPTKKAVEYKTEYLRGYFANTYNKSGQECWNECKTIMNSTIERQILKRYDYDIKLSLNIQTSFMNEQYKYILVPIYVGHYNYKNKLYNFYVNGYNGKIGGKTPVSKIKISITILIGLLILVGFLLLMTYA